MADAFLVDDELTFELRNQATNVAACFHPVSTDQGHVWRPSGHGKLTVMKIAAGWVGVDQSGTVVARPWEPEAGLEADTPPAVTWVRRDGDRAHLLELAYPKRHNWLVCCQTFSTL